MSTSVRPTVGRTFRMRGTGAVVEILDLGLACCAVECAAAFASRPDLYEPVTDADPAAADSESATPGGGSGPLRVLLVSGTVTDVLLPVVLAAAGRLGPGTRVVSYGSCADTGGPYWDSYSVAKGVDQVLPVDRYVPGCAPPPEALLHVLAELTGAGA